MAEVWAIANERAMKSLADAMAGLLAPPLVIGLQGDLGAGKTAFCRYCLRALGVTGAVKSPTFTVVEPYHLGNSVLYHFDFYRLASPEELEFLGLRDYLKPEAICLIEWPEKGGTYLPDLDLMLNIAHRGGEAREVRCSAHSSIGEDILLQLAAQWHG